ncbi:MAG TPA: JAB domain-containing protein [Chryseolinea sp.]
MTIELNDEEKVRILNSDDLFVIMRDILLRENKIDQDREHFWVIGLASNHRLLFIELISMGTVDKALVEPMEVYSVALQKRAVKILLVHNHPSGELKPSEADKDITNRLIQVGLIVNTPVLDHLIITTNSYMSFADTGLLEELKKSRKYVPMYKQMEELQQMAEELGRKKGIKDGMEKGIDETKKTIAKRMKEMGHGDETIVEITGLPLAVVRKL